jgi:ribosomal-protein-alanine N-acetyltransferase
MKVNEKNQPPRIKGDNVFLRYVAHDDYEEMQTIYRESRKLYRGLINPPIGRAAFAAYVDRNLNESDEFFVIGRVGDGKIVGAVNLSQIFRKGFQNAFLGYSLGAEYTGSGHMTEAVELVLKHAFKHLKLHRVEANVQPQNTGSIAVLRRCGFTKEGFSRKYLKISGKWRDHERWAMIVEDWKARNKNKRSRGKQK